MSINHRAVLASIRRFDQLIAYLRDEMDWPITQDAFDDVDDLFFDFSPEELGIDSHNAAKIQEIRRLRPLSTNQPWGIFFVKFEPKRLPVVALRRILSQVALKKRSSANSSERAAWSADDLLFISNYGEGETRQISFAHFTQNDKNKDLPTLKVLGWDNLDTPLHLDHVAEYLTERLAWPNDENNIIAWKDQWRSAFTLRHREVITTSRNLAINLAGLARSIRVRINTILEIENKNGPVTKLMAAFKEALVHDLDEDGFADMYAQTITYGLLSARITNPDIETADGLSRAMPITNPFLKELMETFLEIGGRKNEKRNQEVLDFDELGVSEVVELLNDAKMDMVLRDFGDKNPLEDPVTHFYEQFFADYDNSERFKRGVFYTPRPVVSFIVRSVDELLRSEFDLQYGLADTTTWGEMIRRIDGLKIPIGMSPHQTFVQILDPATGTGTFLVEVIDLIHKTMIKKWHAEGHGITEIEQLWNDYVPKQLLPRLHGYELMMAPYAIAHLKLGLKLFETGYHFDSSERARIYLTNALEPVQEFSGTMDFAIPALAHEAKAVNSIKSNQRFTVVIGNPPYAHLSSNLTTEAMSLVEPYKYIRGERIIERGALSFQKNLQDDYIKFIRLSQLTINKTQTGVIGLITNHSYLSNPTFRGLRVNLIDNLTSLYVVDLHGNSLYKEAKGVHRDDQNVFDIQQGVAISLFLRHTNGVNCSTIKRGDVWGSRSSKYSTLSKTTLSQHDLTRINPGPEFYIFRKEESEIREEYNSYPRITELMPVNSSGIKTHRDHFAIGIDQVEILERITDLCDLSKKDDLIRQTYRLSDTNVWKLNSKRKSLSVRSNHKKYLKLSVNRPFDNRWMYYHPDVVELPRMEVMKHLIEVPENIALCFPRNTREEWCHHVLVSRNIVHKDALSTLDTCYAAPLFLSDALSEMRTTEQGRMVHPNLSSTCFKWLEKLDIVLLSNQDDSTFSIERVVAYFYAILFSENYARRYADFLRTDFPHIPLTTNIDLFDSLVNLGNYLTKLHLMETPKLRSFITRIVGCDNYQVEKVTYSKETVWIDKAKTCGFSGVMEDIWNFHIGGHRVCEKWLKDRQSKGGKNPRPGRVLTNEDIEHYQKIIVSISETIRTMDEIDKVIDAHGGWPGAFQIDNEYVEDSKSQYLKAAEPRDQFNSKDD